MLDGFGPAQVMIVLAIILVLFGGKRIPELMRGLGSGLKEFRRGLTDAGSDDQQEGDPGPGRR